MESLVLSGILLNWDFTAHLIRVSFLSEQKLLNQLALVQQYEDFDPLDPCYLSPHITPTPSPKVTLLKTTHTLLEASFSHSPLLKGVFHFVSSWELLSACQTDAAQFMNHWIRPIRSLHLLSWICVFSTRRKRDDARGGGDWANQVLKHVKYLQSPRSLP